MIDIISRHYCFAFLEQTTSRYFIGLFCCQLIFWCVCFGHHYQRSRHEVLVLFQQTSSIDNLFRLISIWMERFSKPFQHFFCFLRLNCPPFLKIRSFTLLNTKIRIFTPIPLPQNSLIFHFFFVSPSLATTQPSHFCSFLPLFISKLSQILFTLKINSKMQTHHWPH